MNPLDDAKALQEEASKKQAEAERLQKLSASVPNLQKHVGRWNKVVYYSPDANPKATRFDMRHNCGCCSDSPLEVWPYMETEHGNVYSSPPCFQVGERCYLGGDTPYPGWEGKLKEYGLPEVIIGAVRMHFERCKQEALEAVEGAYD